MTIKPATPAFASPERNATPPDEPTVVDPVVSESMPLFPTTDELPVVTTTSPLEVNTSPDEITTDPPVLAFCDT
jgi:hypothetical protein